MMGWVVIHDPGLWPGETADWSGLGHLGQLVAAEISGDVPLHHIIGDDVIIDASPQAIEHNARIPLAEHGHECPSSIIPEQGADEQSHTFLSWLAAPSDATSYAPFGHHLGDAGKHSHEQEAHLEPDESEGDHHD